MPSMNRNRALRALIKQLLSEERAVTRFSYITTGTVDTACKDGPVLMEKVELTIRLESRA